MFPGIETFDILFCFEVVDWGRTDSMNYIERLWVQYEDRHASWLSRRRVFIQYVDDGLYAKLYAI